MFTDSSHAFGQLDFHGLNVAAEERIAQQLPAGHRSGRQVGGVEVMHVRLLCGSCGKSIRRGNTDPPAARPTGAAVALVPASAATLSEREPTIKGHLCYKPLRS